MTQRVFTQSERTARDAYITSHVENDCEGCESYITTDGYEHWTPAQDCPVHGEHYEPWWQALNERLDAYWPGIWARTAHLDLHREESSQ